VVRGGEITDQSLIARRIGEFHTVVAASPEYLKRHGTPKHPTELEGTQHRVVSYFSHRTGKPYPFIFTKGDEKIELTGTPAISVNDSNASLAAGLAGLGVVRTATFMARKHFESGTLVPLLLDWCGESIPIYIVYPPNKHLSTKLRVFVDWVADLFATSPLILRQCCLPGKTAPAAVAVKADRETIAA